MVRISILAIGFKQVEKKFKDGLLKKDLIAFDGTLFQVLSLPQSSPDPQKKEHQSPLGKLIQQAVKGI